MRALLFHHVVLYRPLWEAAGLNVVYLGLGLAIFLRTFRDARVHGRLLNMGE